MDNRKERQGEVVNATSNSIQSGPVKKRIKVLDALRGFALLGVCLANYKELTLYAFYDVAHTTNVEIGMMDKVANFLMYLLVDGKFYTIFSVLFGIGFSIIIGNAFEKGANGMRILYRRMLILLCFGFAHEPAQSATQILSGEHNPHFPSANGVCSQIASWRCKDKTRQHEIESHGHAHQMVSLIGIRLWRPSLLLFPRF